MIKPILVDSSNIFVPISQGSFIRTAFIIGFPGETNADFEELCAFVQREKFESVGIFEYHDEPLAAS